MAELQLVIISVFVILTLPFAAGGAPSSRSVSVGDEITLLCQDAKDFNDSCYSTTWLFSHPRRRQTVPLFEYGKFHRDVGAQSDRLSVTENCSLVIKAVTTLDEGHYTCRQFVSGQQVSQSMVILSVLNTAGSPVFNFTFNGPRDIFPGKDATNATTTTGKPTLTPPPTETTTTKPDMATTIITSVTTTTTVTSLMTKTKTTTTTKTVSPDKITTTKSNTTTITIKSPKKTTTFNSTTTKITIKSARAAEECPNTVNSTMLIIVAAGFVALIIMLAVIIWQIRRRNKTQTSDNIERSTNHGVGPGTSVERVLSERNQDNAAASSDVRASYTSSGAGSGIYATMKRI